MTFGRVEGLGVGGGERRGEDVVGVMVQGLRSGSGGWDGSREGVMVVSRVRGSPNRGSSEVSSSSASAGLGIDGCSTAELRLDCIFFRAFCVRLFLSLSTSLASLAPSSLRTALIASFCSASLDAKPFMCHSKSFTIYASPFSTSSLASSG